jgi:hypothetical protein
VTEGSTALTALTVGVMRAFCAGFGVTTYVQARAVYRDLDDLVGGLTLMLHKALETGDLDQLVGAMAGVLVEALHEGVPGERISDFLAQACAGLPLEPSDLARFDARFTMALEGGSRMVARKGKPRA